MKDSRPSIKITLDPNVKILYSDSVIIHRNPLGFILDFTQPIGPRQRQVVARIGFSQEHARALLKTLARQLNQKPPQKPIILN